MSTDKAVDVRLVTYNIYAMRMSTAALTAVVTECRPDVLCLQEMPRFLFWRRRLRRFAAATGLRVASGHARAGAVAVLVGPRVEVFAASATRLPLRLGRHRRGVATALLEVSGQRFAVASVHMSLYAAERAAHLPRIRSAAEQYGVPAVIAGDLNETDTGAVWRELAARYQDGYASAPEGHAETYSAARPHKRIDGVFADQSFEVAGCGVPDIAGIADASDHRPVIARLRFPVITRGVLVDP